MNKILKKNVCKPSLMKKIISHAGGSMYRMNAGSADCYTFDIVDNGNDWQGGWDWSNGLVDKEAQYILMLSDNKVYLNN